MYILLQIEYYIRILKTAFCYYVNITSQLKKNMLKNINIISL